MKFLSEGTFKPLYQPFKFRLRAVQMQLFNEFLLVLLQSWAESRDDPVSHFLMAAACRRSQAVSKTRLTITASGLGCP